jgi:YD repeat-containing protein
MLNTFCCYGQTSTLPPPDIDRSLIPQTPDAAAFTKYGDIPVNLSRGVPNINIPLFSSKVGKLPVDIILSYSYTGLKPNEVPSWVGLGWTLNIGGMITRTVRGMIDDDNTNRVAYGMLDNLPNPYWFQNNQVFLHEIGANQRDAEPDIYNYSFPGHSGRFVMKNGRAITFPFDNISIAKTGSGFTIITEEGTTYNFNSTETIWTKLQQGSNTPQTYVTGWHLTSMISADRMDVISFGYKAISYLDYSTANGQQVTYTDLYPGNSFISPTADLKSSNGLSRINGLQLTSLQSSALSIVFDLDTTNVRQDIDAGGSYYALKDMVVYGSAGSVVKKVFFSYNYFTGNGNKLKLKQVAQTGANVNSAGKWVTPDSLYYQFSYENESDVFPYSYTNGLDIYGYYNGKDGNGNLAFSTPSGYLPPQGMSGPSGNDRNPYFSYCKYGALNKIVYPTGGYTTFTYELNPGPGIRIKSYTSVDSIANSSYTKSYSYLNSNGGSSIQFLGGSQIYQPFMHYDVQACIGTSEYNQYVANLNAVTGFDYAHLEQQPYFYSTVTEKDSTATEQHVTGSTFNAYGGGLTDVYQTGATQYKQNGSSFTPVQSTSLSYILPTQLADTSLTGVAAKVDIIYCSNAPFPPTNSDPNQRTQMYRGESYTLYSTLRTLSSQITTTYNDNSTNQTVQHLYFYDNPLHRLLTREVVINSAGDSLFTQYTYPFDYPSPCDPTAADRQYKTDLQNLYNTYQSCTTQRLNCTLGASSCYSTYPCETNAYQAFATVLQNWNNNKASYTTCLQNAINSQSDPNMKAIEMMQRDHILNTVVEKMVYKKKAGSSTALLVDAIKTEFTTTASVVVPKAIWSAEVPFNTTLSQFLSNKATYYKRRVNMLYDGNVRLVQQNKENDMKETYLWGYRHQYVVAEIKGSDYDNVSALVNQSVLDNPSSDDALRTELNKVRTGLANTKALVTTYTYAPLLGITSKTDPNGEISYYEYDLLGRLMAVRDLHNNVLKKYCYSYTGRNSGCRLYSNIAKSGSFTRNNCPSGYTPGTVTYTVLAGTYSSTISQADADQQAQNDVNQNGQTYANNNATCTYVCSSSNCTGDNHKCINGACETGNRVNLSSVYSKVYDPASGTYVWKWKCTWQYCFSDGSTSANTYIEYNDAACGVYPCGVME